MKQLASDLAAEGPDADVRREAAIARLRVVGARAVRYLLPLLDSATPRAARIAALRALEGCAEPAVITPVLDTLGDPDVEVRVAGLGTARGLLEASRGPEVLGRITDMALDQTQPHAVRRAAVTALAGLPPRTVRPLIDRLRSDPDPAVHALVDDHHLVPVGDPAATLDETAKGQLPRDPDYVLSLLAEAGSTVAVPVLHHLVTAVRAREAAETRAARRRDWLAVRGAVHRALAARGSRVAAYDLRETFESAADPVPDDFLRAAGAIGDGSVLEALAGAFVRASRPEAQLWRAALADACRAIVARERLSSRHAVVKRLRARWGDAIGPVLPTGFSSRART
jgi:HEAT repeat protein